MKIDFENTTENAPGLYHLKMIVLILVSLVCLAFLVGCTPETKEESARFVLPDELKDCKVYSMSSSDTGAVLHVMRCPNSTTSVTRSGKAPIRTITIDGVEYEATVKEKAQ